MAHNSYMTMTFIKFTCFNKIHADNYTSYSALFLHFSSSISAIVKYIAESGSLNS